MINDPSAQSMQEKIGGWKQEIEGKVKHDPKLVEHGRDLRTGEVKRKEMREVNILLPRVGDYLA